MSSHATTADGYFGGDSGGSVRGWLIFAGIVSLVAGTAALVYENTATIVSVVIFGTFLLFAGSVQIVQAFQFRNWSGFFIYLIDGILRFVVGGLLVAYPGAGAATITLVLAFYFVAAGLIKTIASISLRFPSWGWSVVSGVVSVVLGVVLARQWPTSSMWFIGLAVGVDLIVYGWALLMVAAAIKELKKTFA